MVELFHNNEQKVCYSGHRLHNWWLEYWTYSLFFQTMAWIPNIKNCYSSHGLNNNTVGTWNPTIRNPDMSRFQIPTHLNSEQAKGCYSDDSLIRMFDIQIPTVHNKLVPTNRCSLHFKACKTVVASVSSGSRTIGPLKLDPPATINPTVDQIDSSGWRF